MKQFIGKHQKALTGTIAILLFGALTMSFRDSPFAYSKFSAQEDYLYEGGSTDTLPDKGTLSMKDFDNLQAELDQSLSQANDALKNLDLTKLQREIEASLKEVDMDKIRKDVELALKSIDMEKIMADVSSSLKNISPEYKNTEIEKALTEAKKEIEKAKPELQAIDKDVIKKEMEDAKKEIEKSKGEIDKIDINKIMAGARTGIDKAKEELHLTREMFTEMENDGLINSKNGFTIEFKNKNLYINGIEQSEKTTDKYRKYFKKDHFKITIDKE